MKKRAILIFFILFIFYSQNYSQNQIWLLDGKKISASEINIDTTEYIYYKNIKGKTKSISKFDVFSVEIDENEKIIYENDLEADCFNDTQMKNYVQGRYDGRFTKSPIYFVGGIATGVTAPIFLPMLGINSILTPLVPAGYDLCIGLIKVKDEKIAIKEEFSSNQHYIEGYKTSVKKKRINNAIMGSIIGVTIGLTSAFFIYEVIK